MNTMTINGYQAVIAFDPEIQMFRGEFVGLNGGADFYATDVDGLRHEGEISLRLFLDACEKRGVEPRKHFSGKFSCGSIRPPTRPPPSLLPRMARASISGRPKRLGRRHWRDDGRLLDAS